MARYRLITLIDITHTPLSRGETDVVKIGQQANFNSLLQVIGLRSNVDWNKAPHRHTGRLPDPAEGKATHWIWEFDCEREDVFLKVDDPVGLLKDDLHGVPVISELENSENIDPAAFQTSNGNQNTWLSII